ncbi:hypothetical protein EYF80_040464 [Liparis tanakae]|uniref:Uncharacterized protein n=1 Tax=Liparis tanakae TaxID=230148 RepID=A0A4Z2G965_9TELE|nr:hypothetical protein EYF80_040464 [Liparis tanakae]
MLATATTSSFLERKHEQRDRRSPSERRSHLTNEETRTPERKHHHVSSGKNPVSIGLHHLERQSSEESPT